MTKSIKLPDLVLGPIKYPVGYAWQLLRVGRVALVEREESVQLSPRVFEPCVVLEDGERLLVTSRRMSTIPDGIDGILRQRDNGDYVWTTHKLREAAQGESLKSRAQAAAITWQSEFAYRAQTMRDGEPDVDKGGLRPPQLGALFAIGAHWSLHRHPATIVMPTGTGKTETMLSTLASQNCAPMIVAVPNKALRHQTARKFERFGLLQHLKVLSGNIVFPVVAELRKRPTSVEHLQIFEDCNVVIGVVSSLAGGEAETFAGEIAARCDTLVVDEAHHVAARTWTAFREAFGKRRVLQFTATPYREDGRLVDGEVIFSYGLRQAQEDGYFKPIKFLPVHEIAPNAADEAIAREACRVLQEDSDNGFNHIAMARCGTIARAESVLALYEKLGAAFQPQIIHSDLPDAGERVRKLMAGECRIAVCVNMLGEGFDLPRLKLAALHDPHRSLAPMLQFTGRFTRTSREKIGDATVIANIADPSVPLALERLYGEDSDWNVVLSEMSSQAAKDHARLIGFLKGSTPIGDPPEGLPAVAHQLLRPVFSMLTYACETFNPKAFHKGIDDPNSVVRVWLNEESKTLFFVTRAIEHLKWTRSKEMIDTAWDLFVLHYDPTRKLLYLASTDKSSNHAALAAAVGATAPISGEQVFKALGRIGRLVFQNLGVSKHGRKNLSYAMYTGADVRAALSQAEKSGSRKSNLSGNGWEHGRQVTIGCSYKGRVWSREAGTIPQFIEWAQNVGEKLIDPTISTADIIDNVLIPEEVTALPDVAVLGIEWPIELLRQSEERIALQIGEAEHPLYVCDIVSTNVDPDRQEVRFSIVDVDRVELGQFVLKIGVENGYEVERASADEILIRVGSRELTLTALFNDYPPLVRFVDLSELDGNLLLKPQNPRELTLPSAALDAWSWAGVDVSKESYWKDGAARTDSVQWAVAQRYLDAGFELVFDDDGPGEAADLVCVKEETDYVRLALVHCKFASGAAGAARIEDVVEVASQAVRSAKWAGRFKELCRHVVSRNERRKSGARPSLFLRGDLQLCSRLSRLARFKEVRPEIVIVQPGVSTAGVTEDQRLVLASAVSYLKETVGVDLAIVCSA